MAKAKELQTVYQRIVVGFIFITAVLILAIMYFSFNRAYITIVPKKEAVNIDFTAMVESTPADQSTDVIKGEVFETTVEGSKKFNSSETKVLQTNVTGKVTIINESNRSQDLIAKTRLLTVDNILFRLKNSVTIPAGGKVETDVYADDQNLAMEVGPTKFTIPGLRPDQQAKIYAESYDNFKGVTKESKVVSANDITAARNLLAEELVGQAIDEFKNKTNEGDDSLTTSAITQELKYDIDAKVNEPKDSFTINLKLKVGVVAFNKGNLLSLATEKLKYSLADDKELMSVDEDQFKYTVKSYDLANKRASMAAHLEGLTIIKEDNAIFDKNKLIGLTEAQLAAYFKNFDDIQSVKTSFSPFWVFKVPKLKDHIIIKIEK